MKVRQILHFELRTILPVLILVGTWIVQSCTPPEPFPNTPRISFKELQFKKDERNGFQDSLILYFDFEDGDGNLGLNSEERGFPYHDFEMVVDSLVILVDEATNQRYATFKFVTYGEENIYLPFHLYNPFEGTVNTEPYSLVDNRPAYDCEFYDTLRINDTKRNFIPAGSITQIEGFNTDTLFLVKNPWRHNMFVNFYIDFQGNNQFELFDWEYATSEYGCGQNFNGRFPIWDDDNMGTSLQGTVRYSMLSLGFENILRTREFKLEFSIADRDTTMSNVVLTEPFTLQGLLLRDQSQE